ncbi:MAG: IclR family transcriptional regulator [Alphaproteobacteria bacterium]
MSPPRDDLTVQSVGIAVEVLDAIAAAGKPVRLTQIAERLNMPRARVHRYLKTLKQLGLVWQERSGERYGLGWRLFQLGQFASEQFEIKRLVEGPIRRLRDDVDATVSVSVSAAGIAVTIIVEQPKTRQPNLMVLEGRRLVPHATAQGRIALAFAAADTREQILAQPLRRLTDHTTTDPEVVRRRLERIRAELYEICIGEIRPGVTTFAAPVLDRDGMLAAIVGMLQVDEAAPESRHPELVRAVQRCAAAVSQELSSDAYARIGIFA